MSWPTATDYAEAVQDLRNCLDDEELRGGEAVRTPIGLPMLWSGNFADVYKIHCPASGNTWALKCFTRQIPRQQERYRAIAAHLEQAKLPFTVDFQYLEQGIRINGERFPVLKMRWVEGLMLNQFVEEHVERPQNLKMLLDLWVKLAARLREAGIAHADLQHGNVVLVPMEGGSLALRLIDYDGMYVPALAGTRSGEVGLPAYQHPQRIREGVYNAEVDRFSHLVIYTAIRCLMVGRSELWQRFNTGENLLFRDSDFRHLEASELFRTMWRIDDAHAKALVGRLILACRQPLEESTLLQEIVSADGQVVPLSDEERAAVNAILGVEAVPASTKPPVEPNAAAAPLWISEIAEPRTPSAPAVDAAPPVLLASAGATEEQPSPQGVLEFLNTEQAPPATRTSPVARGAKVPEVPASNAKRWLIRALVMLVALLAILLWSAVSGRKHGNAAKGPVSVAKDAGRKSVVETTSAKTESAPVLPPENNIPEQEQPFIIDFNLFDSQERYLLESRNARIYSEGDVCRYWAPDQNGQTGTVVYRFEFPRKVTKAAFSCNADCFYMFEKDLSVSVEVSGDGEQWVIQPELSLLPGDAPGHGWKNRLCNVSDVIKGRKQLFVRTQLQAKSFVIAAQFLRTSSSDRGKRSDGVGFHVEAQLEPGNVSGDRPLADNVSIPPSPRPELPPTANSEPQSSIPLPTIGSLVGVDRKWNLPSDAPLPAIAPFDEKKAKEHQEAWAKYLSVPMVQTNSIGMKLVLIPPGEFTMGSPEELIEEELRLHGDDVLYKKRLQGEGPQHRVQITRPYWLGVTEVTQEEYQRVMGSNPSHFQGDPKRPVEQVSWGDAVEFCRKLSALSGGKAADGQYQLPSDAQWEYACRAGTTTRWCFGNDARQLQQYGWFRENAGGISHPVGQLKANPWGLYDMYGNVLEWCMDWRSDKYYVVAPIADPTDPPDGVFRVERGGCMGSPARDCRSAIRGIHSPGSRDNYLGFRVCLVPAEVQVVSSRPRSFGLQNIEEGKPPSVDAPPEKPKPDKEAENPVAKKIDLPSAEEQKRLIQEIDESRKVGEAKDPAAKVALARKLLEEGQKDDANRAEQFVLFRRASDLAREAGEADLMLEAVDAMTAAGFNLKPWQVKARLLKPLMTQAAQGPVSQFSLVSQTCLSFAEQAFSNDSCDEAADVIDMVRNALAAPKNRAQEAYRSANVALRRAHNTAYEADREQKVQEAQADVEMVNAVQAAAAERFKGLQQARHEHETVEAAQERLKTAPDDPEACLAVGRWHCFYRGNWDEGLKLLAKGNDAALKSLAVAELASKPAKVDERVAQGDAWWTLAEKAAGNVKAAMRRHAAQWYQEAMTDLIPGQRKVEVEERLVQAAEEPLPEAGGAVRSHPPLAVAPFNETIAKQYQTRWARYLAVPLAQTNSIGMKLVLIPPGEFQMGSSKELIEAETQAHASDDNRDLDYRDLLGGETPQHRVRIAKPFWLGATVVTQEEYQRVMGSNPSKFQGDSKRPVEQVSWNDAVEFCRRLSELPAEKAARRRYGLPTEAQWEHACRAGTTTRWYSSNDEAGLDDAAWFNSNAGSQTHPVGQKRGNAWHLYDMHGNVWEWCQDWYDNSYKTNLIADDPAGPAEGSKRVRRGGSFLLRACRCRSASRENLDPGLSLQDLGFRVSLVHAREAPERTKPDQRADLPLDHAERTDVLCPPQQEKPAQDPQRSVTADPPKGGQLPSAGSKPVIRDVKVMPDRVAAGDQFTVAITVASDAPLRSAFVHFSLPGDNKKQRFTCFGTFKQTAPGEWRCDAAQTQPSKWDAPGRYAMGHFSVENEAKLRSDPWEGEVAITVTK